MAISAKRCGLASFAEDQLRLLDSGTARSAKSVVQAVNNDPRYSAEVGEVQPTKMDASDADTFSHARPEMLGILHRIAKTQPGEFRNFHEHPLDEVNWLTWPNNAEESWQRQLYDELTQDKAHGVSKEVSDHEPSAVSNTGIFFDDLRYLNWKTINSLLVQAQQFDKREGISTDEAIQDRRASPKLKGARSTNPTAGLRYAISTEQLQGYQHDISTEKARATNEDDWRAVILELRKPEHDFQIL